jgi:ABC-2 type transport system permease protein
MAIHKRRYRALGGAELTPAWSRFLVLPRHAWQSLSGSRLITAYLLLCLVPSLVAAAMIYFYNNPGARALLGLARAGGWGFAIDGRFFYWLLHFQGSLALLLTAWVGPGLVAPDLVNGALPLYLSRPFSRAEYVLGRLATLFLVLSAITWLPDLLLFGLQASLAEPGWTGSHLGLAAGIVAAGWLWIAVLALVVLAVSAWVKWRIVATGVFGGVFFMSHNIALATNDALRTSWGGLLSLYSVVTTLWQELLGVVLAGHRRGVRAADPRFEDLPVGACWLAVLVLAAVCVLLLDRRLRGREVVR